MYKAFITLIVFSFLTSCTGKKQMVYENDTDSHEWINQQSVKDVPNAHSGNSVCIIDSVHVFSLGFSKTIENIGNKFKEIHFSYWIYTKSDNAKFSSVFSVDFNGQNINWEAHPAATPPPNNWVKIEEVFTLPPKAEPNNQVAIYVLNQSKEEIYVDDLKIEFK